MVPRREPPRYHHRRGASTARDALRFIAELKGRRRHTTANATNHDGDAAQGVSAGAEHADTSQLFLEVSVGRDPSAPRRALIAHLKVQRRRAADSFGIAPGETPTAQSTNDPFTPRGADGLKWNHDR